MTCADTSKWEEIQADVLNGRLPHHFGVELVFLGHCDGFVILGFQRLSRDQDKTTKTARLPLDPPIGVFTDGCHELSVLIQCIERVRLVNILVKY